MPYRRYVWYHGAITRLDRKWLRVWGFPLSADNVAQYRQARSHSSHFLWTVSELRPYLRISSRPYGSDDEHLVNDLPHQIDQLIVQANYEALPMLEMIESQVDFLEWVNGEYKFRKMPESILSEGSSVNSLAHPPTHSPTTHQVSWMLASSGLFIIMMKQTTSTYGV